MVQISNAIKSHAHRLAVLIHFRLPPVRILLLILVAYLATSLPSFAKECTREEAMAAEDSVSRLPDWKQIYRAFKRFAHCDDGAIAEGFTESVVHLLATQWETLPQVASLESKNGEFLNFVLRHIDGSADTSELKRIAHLARTQCPTGHSLMCSAIFQAATGGTNIP